MSEQSRETTPSKSEQSRVVIIRTNEGIRGVSYVLDDLLGFTEVVVENQAGGEKQ